MPLVAAVGWYASDDGSLIAHGAPHRKGVGETRRFWFDFTAVAEIKDGGDTITSNLPTTPTVTCTGLTFANIAVSGTRVLVDVSGGTVDTEYSVLFTVTLASGAIIARIGKLRVSAI